MRVMIVRRVLGSTFSMDVYTDNLVAALKIVRPNWEIAEIAPIPWNSPDKLWHSGTSIRKYYESFWRHPRAVSQLDADIFHIIDQVESHIAYRLHRLNKPVVVTCHDLVHFIYPEILRDQSRFPALSMSNWKYSVGGMKKANHIIAVSTNTAQDVVRYLEIKPEQITPILNGISLEFQVLSNSEEVAKIKEQYKPSAETFCLLNVGSNHTRKNILTVLKVLRNLLDKQFPACLWRTGSDFTREQKDFIQEYNLEPYVFDLGNPDRTRLVQIYNAADVLLAPSLYEGFGLTIIEAMACGTPVITSKVSSIPEVADSAAILVDPLNVEALTEAIYKIKYNPNYYQELVEKGLLRAKFFSWEKTAEQVAKVYENVLRNSKITQVIRDR